jgi:hypothetical protein
MGAIMSDFVKFIRQELAKYKRPITKKNHEI